MHSKEEETLHHQFFSQRYQAVYNYLPRNEDELELKEGDIVDVMEKCDDGWFVGPQSGAAPPDQIRTGAARPVIQSERRPARLCELPRDVKQ
ncbi:Sorbin and SH3 domain-containing protein 2 [Collichthys lucidus]|uniref:Sorbin and SH3 domain-containing protein 2 n=1 Tax=Collichthys lucidus TaxID=240159 RepID=A0A4U5U4M5_COLLU|nr:Sorbin and SH3 domain-containing protein 2 [Collichthys lucidus]